MKVTECLSWYVPIIPDRGMRPNGPNEKDVFHLPCFFYSLVTNPVDMYSLSPSPSPFLSFFFYFFSPVASQIMAKYGWKDGQGNGQIIFILVLHDNSIYG